MINKNDVIILYVSFFDSSDGKYRPALILSSSNSHFEFLRITSKYSNKPKKIQKLYYRIKDWKEAGLDKPSYIDTGSIINYDKEFTDTLYKIGQLSLQDINDLTTFINDNDNHSI